MIYFPPSPPLLAGDSETRLWIYFLEGLEGLFGGCHCISGRRLCGTRDAFGRLLAPFSCHLKY